MYGFLKGVREYVNFRPTIMSEFVSFFTILVQTTIDSSFNKHILFGNLLEIV